MGTRKVSGQQASDRRPPHTPPNYRTPPLSPLSLPAAKCQHKKPDTTNSMVTTNMATV